MRCAAIDIGSNSVKMLIADRTPAGEVESGSEPWQRVEELGEQTRLAQGLYETGVMNPERIQATLEVLRKMKEQGQRAGVQHWFAFATSAVREAKNQGDFQALLKSELDLDLNIIDGGTEAQWVYRGVIQNPALSAHQGSWMILDVGGGSSECIWGSSGAPVPDFSKSYPIGTVRLLETLKIQEDPPWPELVRCQKWVGDFIRSNIETDLKPCLKIDHPGYGGNGIPPVLILTSGAAHILYRMHTAWKGLSPEGESDVGQLQKEAPQFLESDLFQWLRKLWKAPLEERRTIEGMIPDRADVMLMGILMFHEMLSSLRFDRAIVSQSGLRHGALSHAFGEDPAAAS